MKIYSHSLQGLRQSNEDQHVYFLNIDGENPKINNINFIMKVYILNVINL